LAAGRIELHVDAQPRPDERNVREIPQVFRGLDDLDVGVRVPVDVTRLEKLERGSSEHVFVPFSDASSTRRGRWLRYFGRIGAQTSDLAGVFGVAPSGDAPSRKFSKVDAD
jgi:hypothetical protein